MIAGLLLRNFKTYYGVNFIPFRIHDNEHLNIFIGNNGTGKSSILEALNAYFNDGRWVPHTQTGDQRAYVAPILLLEKEKYTAKFTETGIKKTIDDLNEFFWTTSNIGTSQGFIDFRDKLKAQYSQTHYLLLLGLSQAGKKNLFFAAFDIKIKRDILKLELDENNELKKKTDQNNLNKIMSVLNEMISFIYVPAETDIADFLKLESSGMQDLVNRNLKDAIGDILMRPYDLNNNSDILDYLNEQLLPYIKGVEATIQNIDKSYRLSAGKGAQKLLPKDLIAPIITAFYSKRKLVRDNRPIEDLSSGERKKALVDIVYSFLSIVGTKEKEIIFAIDEPESSLDTENKYDTLNRIEKIANVCNHQTFITTHLYGLLPIIQKGIIHCLENPTSEDSKPVSPIIKPYDAKNFIAERKSDPDDNYFKSFSDLSSSIVSSLRNKEINWLIVEGLNDKNYFEYYLKHLIEGYEDKFRILALGGSGNVKLLYEHLFIPIENYKRDKLRGNVLCLVDTDEGSLEVDFKSKTTNDKLSFKRLQHIKGNVALLDVSNKEYSQKTIIEDALESRKFFIALAKTIEKSDRAEVIAAFQNFEFEKSAECSRIKDDGSILTPLPKVGSNPKHDKVIILAYVNEPSVKVRLSTEYCQQPFVDTDVPSWIAGVLLKHFYPAQMPLKNKPAILSPV